MHSDGDGDGKVTCKQTSINSLKEVVSSIEHVLFSQVVDSQNENKDGSGETEGGVDIDETLQDELCELWDMSMNSVNLAIKIWFSSLLFILCNVSAVTKNSN